MFDPENNILTIEEGQKIEAGKFKDRNDIHQVIFKGKAEIGVGAFEDCTGIRELIIPEGVIIHESAFRYCTGITQLSISKEVSIDKEAFSYCTGITQLSIQKRVSLGDWAFGSCTGITELTLAQGVKIGYGTFSYCTGITELTLSEGVSADERAFTGCTGITNITLSEGVSIGMHGFSGCTNIMELTISDRVMIGNGAFVACDGINTIYAVGLFNLDRLSRTLPVRLNPQVIRQNLCFSLGSSPKSIKGSVQRAFAKLLLSCNKRLETINNNKDTSVIKLPTLPTELWWCIMSWVHHGLPDKSAPLHSNVLRRMRLTADEEEYKKFQDTWYEYSAPLSISKGENIAESAFTGRTGIKQLTIPERVSIRRRAFDGCTGITHLTLSEGVRVDWQAFSDCTSITNLTISEGVSIASGAFNDCRRINTIHAPYLFNFGPLRGSMPMDLDCQVIRKNLNFSLGSAPMHIKGSLQREFAKLLFLCGERLARINGNEEDTSVNKLSTLPDDIWWCIMSRVHHGLPDKVTPLHSGALRLTADEEEYKQFQSAWQEYREVNDDRPKLIL